MNWSHIAILFRKDAVELLRDRRTLFVNLILPVLLYPLITVFALQSAQVAKTNPADLPRLALIDPPEDLYEAVRNAADGLPAPRGSASAAGTATGAASDRPPNRPVAEIRPVGGDDLTSVRRLLMAADAADADPGARAALVRKLRDLRLVCVLWTPAHGPATAAGSIRQHPVPGGQERLVIAVDDGAARHAQARQAIDQGVAAWRRQLIEARLAAAGLPAAVMDPIATATWTVANRAEAARSALSGVLPWLLVLLVLTGVFLPAVDLVAGERERGSLETLLSLPVGRRELLAAKLLVAVASGLATAALNLVSLAATVGLAAGQLKAAGSIPLDGILQEGGLVLGLAFLTLVPITVLMAALAVAVAGMAASVKEAQNYISPLAIGVMAAAGATLLPDIRPGLVLDLVPITGPLLVLRECLSGGGVPWMHLLLATAASFVSAWVVAGWALRRFEDERFVYPGLVMAGWGRWRRWGARPGSPGPMEALGLFAAALGLFLLLPPWLGEAAGVQAREIAQVIGGLVVCLLLPALVFTWAGDFDPRRTLRIGAPRPVVWPIIVAMVPFALASSLGWFTLQGHVLPKDLLPKEFNDQMALLNRRLGDVGFVLAISVTPAICEEFLFRGPLLAGLRRGIGIPGAVVVTAFLFAAMHLSPYRFLPQFALGIALGALVVRTGSIWPAVLLHGLHNACAVIPELPGLPAPAPGEHGIQAQLQQLSLLGQAALLSCGLAGMWFCIRVMPRSADADADDRR